MIHLYLIRHGQAANLRQGIVGSAIPDSGLSELGVRQAERLRDRLLRTREIQADILLSSPLRRAYQTAEIIAPALKLPVIVDNTMQEFNLGECEGLTIEQIQERYGVFDLNADRSPFQHIAPNGDSWAEFTSRVCGALDRFMRVYDGKTLVVICHGRVIDASFIYFQGLNPFKQLPIVLNIENTSITHWQLDVFDGFGWSEPHWCLRSYNDVLHLAD
jgi:2,3-bisphosphoglycerate-dependent phosphoglycerate mutase